MASILEAIFVTFVMAGMFFALSRAWYSPEVVVRCVRVTSHRALLSLEFNHVISSLSVLLSGGNARRASSSHSNATMFHGAWLKFDAGQLSSSFDIPGTEETYVRTYCTYIPGAAQAQQQHHVRQRDRVPTRTYILVSRV